MEPYEIDAEEFCPQDVPCVKDWDMLSESGVHENRSSLTHLNGLSGVESDMSTYNNNMVGAEFKIVDYIRPNYIRNGYEKTEEVIVKPPWTAEFQEKTFMNEIKARNEPPVPTYRDLKLSPIPTQRHETYVPIIYRVEGFDGTDRQSQFVMLIKLLIVIATICLVYFMIKDRK